MAVAAFEAGSRAERLAVVAAELAADESHILPGEAYAEELCELLPALARTADWPQLLRHQASPRVVASLASALPLDCVLDGVLAQQRHEQAAAAALDALAALGAPAAAAVCARLIAERAFPRCAAAAAARASDPVAALGALAGPGTSWFWRAAAADARRMLPAALAALDAPSDARFAQALRAAAVLLVRGEAPLSRAQFSDALLPALEARAPRLRDPTAALLVFVGALAGPLRAPPEARAEMAAEAAAMLATLAPSADTPPTLSLLVALLAASETAMLIDAVRELLGGSGSGSGSDDELVEALGSLGGILRPLVDERGVLARLLADPPLARQLRGRAAPAAALRFLPAIALRRLLAEHRFARHGLDARPWVLAQLRACILPVHPIAPALALAFADECQAAPRARSEDAPPLPPATQPPSPAALLELCGAGDAPAALAVLLGLSLPGLGLGLPGLGLGLPVRRVLARAAEGAARDYEFVYPSLLAVAAQQAPELFMVGERMRLDVLRPRPVTEENAEDFVRRTFPAVLAQPLAARKAAAKRWRRLDDAHACPAEFRVLTFNCLCGRAAAGDAWTLAELVAEPVRVLQCPAAVYESPGLLGVVLLLLETALARARAAPPPPPAQRPEHVQLDAAEHALLQHTLAAQCLIEAVARDPVPAVLARQFAAHADLLPAVLEQGFPVALIGPVVDRVGAAVDWPAVRGCVERLLDSRSLAQARFAVCLVARVYPALVGAARERLRALRKMAEDGRVERAEAMAVVGVGEEALL